MLHCFSTSKAKIKRQGNAIVIWLISHKKCLSTCSSVVRSFQRHVVKVNTIQHSLIKAYHCLSIHFVKHLWVNALLKAESHVKDYISKQCLDIDLRLSKTIPRLLFLFKVLPILWLKAPVPNKVSLQNYEKWLGSTRAKGEHLCSRHVEEAVHAVPSLTSFIESADGKQNHKVSTGSRGRLRSSEEAGALRCGTRKRNTRKRIAYNYELCTDLQLAM